MHAIRCTCVCVCSSHIQAMARSRHRPPWQAVLRDASSNYEFTYQGPYTCALCTRFHSEPSSRPLVPSKVKKQEGFGPSRACNCKSPQEPVQPHTCSMLQCQVRVS